MKEIESRLDPTTLRVSKAYDIDMPKGYYLSWICTTQAAFKITVTLADEKKTYFTGSKSSTSINPPLAIGSETMVGTKLKLTIDIPQSTKIKTETNKNFVEVEGSEVARCCTLLAEDSNDDDYNDVHLSIIGWKHKG